MNQRPGSYPVSVKGVVARHGLVLLLYNERDEWELPGGRLELDETPAQCVTREIAEETGWTVETGPILDSWVYHIDQVGSNVFIVTYGCRLASGQDGTEPILSSEHRQFGLFSQAQVADLAMPQGYKNSIATWLGILSRPDQTIP